MDRGPPQAGRGGARVTTPSWRLVWETALAETEHGPLSRLLAASFPHDTSALDGSRSWVGARPELRVIGCDGGRPVAHAGVVRRFLRAPACDTSVLVGDVGLVAVDPARRGERLGAALMAAVGSALSHLDLPFGFLTCDDAVRPFYERCGWTAVDQVLRSVTVHHRVETGRHNGMLLRLGDPATPWPARGPLERNGQEL